MFSLLRLNQTIVKKQCRFHIRHPQNLPLTLVDSANNITISFYFKHLEKQCFEIIECFFKLNKDTRCKKEN